MTRWVEVWKLDFRYFSVITYHPIEDILNVKRNYTPTGQTLENKEG
jgi:hypothetical protein